MDAGARGARRFESFGRRADAAGARGIVVTFGNRRAEPCPKARRRTKRIVVVGANVGKTTLFNELTKQNARSATALEPSSVEPEAVPTDGLGQVDANDVGRVFLSARSAEEIVLSAILGLGRFEMDLVPCVVDAGQLVRNLYLVLQIELACRSSCAST